MHATRPGPAPVLLLLALSCAGAPTARSPAPEDHWSRLERPGWQLDWHDEFDGPALDRTRWTFDQGGLFRNAEMQFYTDRPANVRTEGGHLIIEARREDFYGSD